MDPRLTPHRTDLAADWLQGQVEAERYVAGTKMQVVEPVADVRRDPRLDAALDTQAVCGDTVTIYEETAEGWAWGQLASDGYVGYLPSSTLSKNLRHPTHRVNVPTTLTYTAANIKQQPVEHLPMGAGVAVVEQAGDFCRLSTGRYAWALHLSAIETFAEDFVAVCEQLISIPYLWGGTSAWGLDCSGLVCTGLRMAGIECPRDSDMLENSFGIPLGAFGEQSLQRGDLVFWKGHIGIMRDEATLLHANGYHMQVASEPLVGAVDRIAHLYAQPTTCRRPPALSAAAAPQDRTGS
ncbi:MAG: C40 family peptidase [Alphaproteobacteria bacterium]|nr:C40 family peptidase [Alphaproteobacteria bacterium]